MVTIIPDAIKFRTEDGVATIVRNYDGMVVIVRFERVAEIISPYTQQEKS